MDTKSAQFRRRVKASFYRVKQDMDSFKSLMTSWILKFQRENDALKDEVKVLKKRIKFVEERQLEYHLKH